MLTNEELLNAIDDIDDAFIAEAAFSHKTPQKCPKINHAFFRYACICTACAAAVILMVLLPGIAEHFKGQPVDSLPGISETASEVRTDDGNISTDNGVLLKSGDKIANGYAVLIWAQVYTEEGLVSLSGSGISYGINQANGKIPSFGYSVDISIINNTGGQITEDKYVLYNNEVFRLVYVLTSLPDDKPVSVGDGFGMSCYIFKITGTEMLDTSDFEKLDQPNTNILRNDLKYGNVSDNKIIISVNADGSIPVLCLPASFAEDFPVAGYNITSFTAYSGKNWLVMLSDVALGSQNIRIIVKGSDEEWHIIGDSDSVGCREVVSGAGFADEKTGFISYRYLEADDLKIRRTTDGGITWEWVVIDVPDKYSSYKKTPLSPLFQSWEWLYPIALYGETGYVKTTWLRSLDRGQTWEFAGDLTVY